MAKRKPKKFADLKELPEADLEKIEHALKHGESPWFLADRAQNQWGLFKNKSRHAVNKMLTRYRDEITTDREILENSGAVRTLQRAERQFEKNVNVLNAFSQTIAIQMHRIKMDHEKEKKVKLSLKQNNENIKVMAQLLREYGDLSLKVGLLRQMGGEEGDSESSLSARDGIDMLGKMSRSINEDDQLKSGFMGLLGRLAMDVEEAEIEDEDEDEDEDES